MNKVLMICLSWFIVGITIISLNHNKVENNLKVSFPEEMCLAKQGDVLIVEKVSDSIYLGFKGKIKQTYPLEWRVYALDLQEQGYTKEASEHIAKVEFKIIPVDEEYISLMED